MSNKNLIMFVMTLLVLIIGISAVGAVDVANDTSAVATTTSIQDDSSTTNDISSDISSVKSIEKTSEVTNYKSNSKSKDMKKVDSNKKTDNTKTSDSTNTKQKTVKTDKSLKTATTHVVTNQTFNQYFTNGLLNDNVSAGDTLDLQGNFKTITGTTYNYTMTINKPVNIISSTHNSNISLNTTSTDFFGKQAGDAFTITDEANGTNVTGLYFYNSQIFVIHSSNVVLNNITVINENQIVGGGVGILSVRANSVNVTVKNSNFRTQDNGGHSTLVGANVYNCVFDNNTIRGVGNVGNLIYLTTYNVDIADLSHANDNNIISNNKIYGPEVAQSICYGIAICGNNNTVENNTVEYNEGSGITIQWGSGTGTEGDGSSSIQTRDSVYKNNVLLNGSNFYPASNSVVINNTVTGTTTLTYNNTIANNSFNSLSLSYSYNISNSKIGNLTIQSSSSKQDYVFENNTIENVTFNVAGYGDYAGNTILKNNNISNSVIVNGGSGSVGNITIDSSNINGFVDVGANRNQRISNITISNNNITSPKEYAIKITKMASGVNITNNLLVSNTSYGDSSIISNSTDFTVSNNIPGNDLSNTTITLTQHKYIREGSTVVFTGNYTDKDLKPIANANLKLLVNGISNTVVTNDDGTYTYTYTASTLGNVIISVTDYVEGNDKASYNTTEFTVISQEPRTFEITNKTFNDYFTNGILDDFIVAGDTLDFLGNFISSSNGTYNYSMTINKPVNIISSTEDALIYLNTTSSDFFGNDVVDAFTITDEANGTNVTGLSFYNSQIFVIHASNVVFDNISTINENREMGSGVGIFSIRANSVNVTVKNSYFKTENNGGHSSLVGAWASNCTFDNNTFEGIGRVGNFIYFTTYNVKIPDLTQTNEFNVISNNKIYRTYTSQSDVPICYGIAICGNNNTIENNTVEYDGGMGITVQWGSGTDDENGTGIPTYGTIYKNNVLLNGSSFSASPNSTVINNTVTGNATLDVNSIIKNNTFNSLYLNKNVTVEDCTIGTLTIQSADDTNSYTVKNNTINDIVIQIGAAGKKAGNILIANNTITNSIQADTQIGSANNITISSNDITGYIKLGQSRNQYISDVVIDGNDITSPTNYTVVLTAGASNVNVTNNVLYANGTSGDNSIQSSASNVILANNTPLSRSNVTIALPNYDMYIFDYSSIVVNVTDENGNAVNGGYVIFKVNGVTLKSNGKFYSQETNPMKFSVVNGKATIVFNATSFYNKKYVHSIIVKYSGTTSQYNSASSDTKTLTINKRLGYMTVTTDKSSYNLYETVNIKATYYDITHGNATPIYSDNSCYAIYKINGVTSKVNGSDEKFAINNSQVNIGNNSKSQINYIHIDHTAPNGKDSHLVEVKTHNEYYTTLVGNTTITLNKSPTHIDINKVTFNKTSKKITISADIKDYKNNNTKGTNYYSVKINGITYKAQGKTTFSTTGGNIEITINSTTQNVRNIELVTREKLAYDGSRTTTTNIQTVK